MIKKLTHFHIQSLVTQKAQKFIKRDLNFVSFHVISNISTRSRRYKLIRNLVASSVKKVHTDKSPVLVQLII